MVKAASHHGLDRKYKPWRRGKSQNAKGKKGSLKQQLRGLRRLLAKKAHDGDDNNDNEQTQQIQQQIQELEEQIGEKQKVEQQKNNARKSHGVRFLERQRLTRMWQTASKLGDTKEREREQYHIGLDMLYVAHYPLQVRYQPLFRKNERILLDGRNLARRAAARGKILRQVATLERVTWIPAQVYDDCPTEWSNDKERETFGVVAPCNESDPVANDDRFSAAADKHSAILQAALAVDAELDAQEDSEEEKDPNHSTLDQGEARTHATGLKDMDDDDASASDGIVSEEDDSDNADPLEKGTLVGKVQKSSHGAVIKGVSPLFDEKSDSKPAPDSDDISDDGSSSSDSSGSSSSSSSDEDSDDDDEEEKDNGNKKIDDVKKSSGSERGADGLHAKEETPGAIQDDDDADDFLMPADTAPDDADIFANAKEHVPSRDEARGDKSQGWATQRQRPGQFKKRRVRK